MYSTKQFDIETSMQRAYDILNKQTTLPHQLKKSRNTIQMVQFMQSLMNYIFEVLRVENKLIALLKEAKNQRKNILPEPLQIEKDRIYFAAEEFAK